MMSLTKRYFLPLIAVAIATSISSCSSNPSATQDTASEVPAPTPTANVTSFPSPSQTPSMAQLRAKSDNIGIPSPQATTESTPAATTIETPTAKESPTEQAATGKTTNVTLYTSDTQCQQLIPQKVAVPADEPVEGAVSKILEQRDSGDFNLSSYRVNLKNGVATVDLRVSPNSKRQIASLSSCEQFAMFGSLRKTLTSNPQWKIKEVRFTERGEEIVL
ncbi:GerMN domain-containing protein [Calothrix membranacea FACHB-236]|nr:GerMN domain-containing protein [Calothrix membranacea FACHB-236]